MDFVGDPPVDTGFRVDHFSAPEFVDAPSSPQAPAIVVRCIAEHEGRWLLCRRADVPRRGAWCTPGGFLENGETMQAAASREAREEAGAHVAGVRLLALHEFPQIGQIVALFRANLVDANVSCGDECTEVALFDVNEVPWDSLAFPTDSLALRWLRDERPHEQQIHLAEFTWDSDGRIMMRAK